MQLRPRQVVNCPHCGIANLLSASRCAACSKDLVVYIGPAHQLPKRYGVGSLMGLVASLGVGFGLLRTAPVLGVLILLLIPAALVRAMAAGSQRASDERPMSTDEWMATFVNSIGVMLAVLTLSVLAFAVVAMPAGSTAVGSGRVGMQIAMGLAVVVGIGVAVGLLRKLWPYKG